MPSKLPGSNPVIKNVPSWNVPWHRNTGSMPKDRKEEALTVRQLREWIERQIHLDLKHAAFDTEDASLLPAAGAQTLSRGNRSCSRSTHSMLGASEAKARIAAW